MLLGCIDHSLCVELKLSRHCEALCLFIFNNGGTSFVDTLVVLLSLSFLVNLCGKS